MFGNTSDVLLWASHDGVGEEWAPYSLSYHHNAGAQQWRGVVPFDWKVNASNTTGLGPRETNGYTSIAQLNASAAVVYVAFWGPVCTVFGCSESGNVRGRA